ncbi:hypothetical protein Bca52824_090599 [Brassica carinata]|uniref:Uncharacterized protein n=1 Tax=Brassica carinata TaxID=52824 RepID=A0A8X7NXH5_BRACI|nr:hypothetical protein Bca52824_090599 [Brassica carinata]
MEIKLPTDDITEVEFEYIKIETLLYMFLSFHEEADCLQRLKMLLLQKQDVGNHSSIALRESRRKRRHDDIRGYRRPEESRPITRTPAAGCSQTRRDRSSGEALLERVTMEEIIQFCHGQLRSNSDIAERRHQICNIEWWKRADIARFLCSPS